MKNKLIYKFIMAFIAATLVSFFIISFFLPKMLYKYYIKTYSDEMYRQASLLADYYLAEPDINFESPSENVNYLNNMSKMLKCDILFCSESGHVFYTSTPFKIKKIKGFDPTASNRKYFTDHFFNTFELSQLTVFFAVHRNFENEGYFILSRPLNTIYSMVNKVFNYNYFTFGITTLALVSILLIFIHNVSRPLHKLSLATAAYSKGSFTNRTKMNRNDEIGRLASSLNYMADELSSSNEYQKKFIANISHDFRSPLTSIKGYLEAILDGTIPPEMQGKYLGIVISETDRLAKLTNNLLTMNNMDSSGQALDIIEFDIVSMIKKVIESFEGTCEKKGIKFKLVLTDKKLSVAADYSKIQQVIYNLVDNAIKFSHHNSSIIISVYPKSDKVLTSIKDFGLGIPKDCQSKIWDRFYKTDLSRGKDKKGTGLGLSIVKDIITAHNEYIDLISTEGVGSEFIFSLPRAKENEEQDS